MNKDNIVATSGLLSKIAQTGAESSKVRQGSPDAARSRQVLHEIIRRKRRNDLVRRSEFEHLRALIRRKNEQAMGDLSGQLSMFHASTRPAQGARGGGTLRKINEIEAQMSRLWWKGTATGDISSRLPTSKNIPSTGTTAAEKSFAPTAVQPAKETVKPLKGDTALESTDDTGLDVKLNLAIQTAQPASVPLPPPTPVEAPPPEAPPPEAEAEAEALPSQPDTFVHDAELEEAAICFANGDWLGARASLMELLERRKKETPESQHELWMTCFDLYRATGQKAGFDALALDYAARCSRSAPLWFSLPEQLGLSSLQESVTTDSAGNKPRPLEWSAQPQLSAQSLAALRVLLTRAAQPWTFNWQRLTGIQPSAVTALAELFESWCDETVDVRFVGAAALYAVLESYTQTGDRSGDPAWWRLRLAALRLIGQEEAFDTVAIDYCITYEVSPPSWVAPRCTYSDDAGTNTPVQAAGSIGDTNTGLFGSFLLPHMSESETLRNGTTLLAHKAELTGQIENDATALLESFSAPTQLDLPLIVSCERLIRLDFAASGSVLNWVAVQQAQGRMVQFVQLHRLAAVFFNVVGINEHALIVVRKD